MGYYTRHELDLQGKIDYSLDYEVEISNFTDYSHCFEDCIKWYDCENDMRNFSKQYPETVFIITGYGEENDDIWRAYFQNGKMFKTKAKFVFEEFSSEKLS